MNDYDDWEQNRASGNVEEFTKRKETMPHEQLLKNLRWSRKPDVADEGIINHTIVHGISFLAAKLLEEEHDQIVCKSGTGFYIGATDEETGEPVSRDSVEYWRTKEEAFEALKNRSWTQRVNA